ncbi:hypothetical protein AZ34_10465 [Hylemonella gracilis str. Niagara R]|uniref:DUF2514 family protein n=1 Tax=Hylemonella gracilis str. Niagara R TaxID=1458275 RepID=A0A016XHS6_9BURK|nr:hypothetical protein [Hylemonella gracilis]EYC51455.1 hypothetical protein AZ34_10465 [Hylemonella gracilis str. Niagara R]
MQRAALFALSALACAALVLALHLREVSRADAAGYARAQGEASQLAADLSREFQKGKDRALDDAQKRLATERAAADRSRVDADRLREQLRGAERRIAAAPDAAVRKYASTVTELFDACVREYRDVAAAAAGHAADVRTLIAAWPRMPGAPVPDDEGR